GYQGYIADEGKAATIKTETDKAKELDKVKDYYKYQALKYRKLMGQERPADEADFKTLDTQFNAKPPTEWAQDHKDRPRKDVEDMVIAVEKRFKLLMPEKGQPPEGIQTYEKALDFLVRQADAPRQTLKA